LCVRFMLGVVQQSKKQKKYTSGMSARKVTVEVCLGYKEEISEQGLEHKEFG